MQLKADRRSSAVRTSVKLKAARRSSAVRTSMKLKADRRTSASRTSAGLKADYRGSPGRTTEGCGVGHVSKLPSCTFGPNIVGGDCFFLCVQTATGHSVHSQRVFLSLAMTEGDLELYRYLHECSAVDLAAAISTNAAEGRVSDISLHRARIVADEMDFARGGF